MPHDNNGELIEVGDTVMFVGKVTSITSNPEYCNIEVNSVLPAKPDGAMATFWFNANQVTIEHKIGEPE